MAVEIDLDSKEADLLRRAELPELLRDQARMGAATIELTMTAQTALALAADIEFAVRMRPNGASDAT